MREGLERFITRYRPDEVIITAQIFDQAKRIRSLEIASAARDAQVEISAGAGGTAAAAVIQVDPGTPSSVKRFQKLAAATKTPLIAASGCFGYGLEYAEAVTRSIAVEYARASCAWRPSSTAFGVSSSSRADGSSRARISA